MGQMSKCKKCKSEIVWKKQGDRWYCYNPDKSEHWDLCASIRNKGKPAMRIGRTIIGEHYKPDGCDCGLPPWELCRVDCEHGLYATEFDLLANEHMRAIR